MLDGFLPPVKGNTRRVPQAEQEETHLIVQQVFSMQGNEQLELSPMKLNDQLHVQPREGDQIEPLEESTNTDPRVIQGLNHLIKSKFQEALNAFWKLEEKDRKDILGKAFSNEYEALKALRDGSESVKDMLSIENMPHPLITAGSKFCDNGGLYTL